MPSVGTPFGIHLRPKVEEKTRKREGSQSNTYQPAQPKEEDFNNSRSHLRIRTKLILKITYFLHKKQMILLRESEVFLSKILKYQNYI